MSGETMEYVSAVFGEGRYQIKGAAILCGDDVHCSFVGGTRPHIGAASLSVYEPERDSATVSTICAFGHRDDRLSADCAKKMTVALQCTASVSVGIHIDNAAPEELQWMCENFEECRKRLLREIEKRRNVHGRTEI